MHSDEHNLRLCPLVIGKPRLDGGILKGIGITGDNTKDLEIRFVATGDPVDPQQVVRKLQENTFKICLEQEDNAIRIVDAYWSRREDGGIPDRRLTGKVSIPGFKVEKDPVYSIFNDLNDPMGIRSLQFLSNVAEIPFESLIEVDARFWTCFIRFRFTSAQFFDFQCSRESGSWIISLCARNDFRSCIR